MTCACANGRLCAEHLGEWLDRKSPDVWREDERGFMVEVFRPWRLFPAEPTCERCIVKVEGGFVLRRCVDCAKEDVDGH